MTSTDLLRLLRRYHPVTWTVYHVAGVCTPNSTACKCPRVREKAWWV